ncbi:hypothetical protein AB0A77_13605 [Streptomyces varsoviensis]
MHKTPVIWRWRHNPLRRGTDLVEAWVGLIAVLLMLVAAPAAGWVVGSLAHGALRQTVREQQQHRHLVTATTVRLMPRPPMEPDPETASGHRPQHRRVLANWTAPGGSTHTGVVSARRVAASGDRFPLWTDDRGRAAARPMDTTTAAAHAALAGLGTAGASAGLVEGVRRLIVRRLMRRRYARWDRAWARAGQTWGRAGAGS